MTLKDAAIVSAVAATGTYVVIFLADVTLGQIRADVMEFLFESAKAWLCSFFGNFLTLSGLAALLGRKEE